MQLEALGRTNPSEAIFLASSLLESVLRYSPNGFVAFDRELRIRLWSPALEKIFGLTAREVIGRDVLTCLPFLRGPDENGLRSALAGKSSHVTERAYDVPESRKSGWFDADVFPLFIPGGGTVAGGAAIVTDVTEAKRARARQQESESRFQNMANGSPVMLWMSGTDGLCNFFNQTWLDFSGRTLQQEWGVGWSEMIHPADFQLCMDTYFAAFNKRRDFEMEYRLQRKDGEFRWILDRGSPRFTPDGAFAGYIGSCVDITERKRLEGELKQAVRLRDDFLSIASHELKTPLTSLSLQLGMLQRAVAGGGEGPKIVDRVRATADVSKRQLGRLTKLIEELLDVSRINSGKLPLDKQQTDLIALATTVLDQVSSQAKQSGCAVKFTAPDSAIRGVWDSMRIEQVLANLLTNAFRYASGAPVEVTIWQEGALVKIEVADHGPGIAPAEQEMIFHKFHRATATSNTSGLGLGLFIVKEIVERHGGTVEVRSSAGRGATFTVSLPQT